ncbi:hypothetical protein Tco_0650081 [Tanacetum coccineum]
MDKLEDLKYVSKDPYEEVARQALKQAPPSPAFVPDPMELEHHVPVYVPEPVYPEYLASLDDDIPVEDQPLPADASPAALSPGYMAHYDPKKDLKEGLEEDYADYPADGGDDDDDESSNNDDDDDDVEEDEEEEHLAPANSTDVASPVVDWKRIFRKGQKTKPKTTKLSTEWKSVKRRSIIKAKESIKPKSQQKSQIVNVKVNPDRIKVNSERLKQKIQLEGPQMPNP